MKLSELLQQKINIQEARPSDTESMILREFGSLRQKISDIGDADAEKSLDAAIGAVREAWQNLHQDIDDTVAKLDQAINEQGKQYYLQSYRLYSQDIQYETAEYVFNRPLALSQPHIDLITARLNLRSDWLYPGLILRPSTESWIKHLVALDPLYVIDVRHDLLEPARANFNEQYQFRMRCYAIDEQQENILWALPENQIGLAFCYNFFHYRPLELLRSYLSEFFRILRPGGVLAFTFNDCDAVGGVRLVEKKFMCYIPGGLVRDLAVSLGYDIEHSQMLSASCAWLELRKPGALTSLRGGQSLAKIIDKKS